MISASLTSLKAACVFSIDDAYVTPFKVFFHSLEATCSLPKDIAIYILHTDSLSQHSIGLLLSFLSNYNREPIFLDASHHVPDNLPIKDTDHVSTATFYRLFIANILPHDVDLAVYLDADMLALRSADFLFSRPVSNLVAAVDHCTPINGLRLWGDCGGEYFQAGVLVIPLKKWRDHHLAERFLRVINDERDRIQWWDQDVLNLALSGEFTRLPIWFNVCDSVVETLPHEELDQNAIIIHFSGNSKPWSWYHPSPYTDQWDAAYKEVFGVAFDRSSLKPHRKRVYKQIIHKLRAALSTRG
jgi:lipopolysaccharide biosynthesis glycosyltransferase